MSPKPLRMRKAVIVSPGGPPDAGAVERGVNYLRRYFEQVQIMPHAIPAPDRAVSYLAASDDERAADLNAAFADPDVDLILSSRGGYGCARLLDKLDFSLPDRGVRLAGYSDVTALHLAMDRHGFGIPVTAPMATKIADVSAAEAACFEAALAERAQSFPITVIKPGTACGRPLAGNLTVTASLAGTAHLPDFTGRILVIEDVNEAPYRLDRCLTQLDQCGMLGRCAALVAGEFTGVADSELDALLRRFADRINGPVVRGFPFGHTRFLAAFSWRQNWVIEQGQVRIAPQNLL